MAVEFTDNSGQVLKEFERKVDLALKLIGADCERFAKEQCPVDTGRLRNSITYATSTFMGQGTYSDNQNNIFDDATAKTTPDDKTVYIGSNVEYAEVVEFRDMEHETGNAHFLKNAATTHNDRYKKIAETALKSY